MSPCWLSKDKENPHRTIANVMECAREKESPELMSRMKLKGHNSAAESA